MGHFYSRVSWPVISGTIMYRHRLVSAFVQIKDKLRIGILRGEMFYIDLEVHCCSKVCLFFEKN